LYACLMRSAQASLIQQIFGSNFSEST
jgi:hypothetical protein